MKEKDWSFGVPCNECDGKGTIKSKVCKKCSGEGGIYPTELEPEIQEFDNYWEEDDDDF